MSNKENIKEMIVSRTKEIIPKLANENHCRVKLKSFSDIEHKMIGNIYAFYSPVFKNRDFEFFNDEEKIDFFLFEENRVYINYNENFFNFSNAEMQEKILEVDLDNEEVRLPKDANENEDAEGKDNEDMEEQNEFKVDLISVSYFPLCPSHCNITLCFEQELAQVLSSELIVKILNIFPLINNESLVCGYDSLGAGCVINQLHFEFLTLDDFADIHSLPIDNLNAKPLIKTRLRHKKKDEISMFDGTTTIYLNAIEEPFYAWKIECDLKGDENENIINDNHGGELSSIEGAFQNSISHIVNFILSKLIDAEKPHNIIITNQGKTFYLIPRNFEDKKLTFGSCWTDLAGLLSLKDKKSYDEANYNDIMKLFKSKISIEKNEFDSLNNMIISQIDNVYEITKITN